MADELGATVVVLKEIRLSKEDRPVSVDDNSLEGRRRKWEAWQAEQQARSVKAADESANKSEDSGGTNGSHKLNKGGVVGRNSNGRSWWKKKNNISLHTASTVATAEPVVQDPPASLVTPSSILTAQLVPSKQSQDRSIRKKRYPSLLDRPDHHSYSASKGFNGEDHHTQPCPTSSKNDRHSRPKDDNDDCGIFAVLDLELDATASIPSTSLADQKKDSGGGRGSFSSKPAGSKSTKQLNSEEKATRRKLKRDEADAAALKPTWGEHGEGPFPDSDKEDYGAWGGQSLDVWGTDDASVAQTKKKEGPVAANVPSSLADNVVLPSLKDCCITSFDINSTETTVLPPRSSSPTLLPSPLLLPTYRPASSLLSKTSDAAFPPFHEERGSICIKRHNGNGDGTGQITHGFVAGDGAVAGAEGQGQAYEEVEDGTERICVEVLVLRKEMEGHIRFDDVARWLNGGGN